MMPVFYALVSVVLAWSVTDLMLAVLALFLSKRGAS